MNTQIRYGAYSLLGISIVLAVLVAYPELDRSKAKALESPAPVERVWDDTETFTPPPDGLQTWYVFHEWHNDRWNCSKFHPASGSGPAADVPAAQVLVGYINHYDGGSGPLPCEENSKDAYRGTIWFDLSKLSGKLPVAATATLNFKQVPEGVAAYDGDRNPITRVCDDRLFLANVDWRKGWESKGAVPEGDLVSPVNGCAGGCEIDVTDIVNNWTTGAANNYGFVIVGENEDWLDKLIPNDQSVCETRYTDFTLTVKLKKAAPIRLPTPIPVTRPGPRLPGGDTPFACTNYALGAKVTAKNRTKDEVGLHFNESYAIDGIRHTTTDGGNYWRDEHGLPTWIQIEFKDPSTTIDEITVVTIQDPGYDKATDPTDIQTFARSGVTAFDVKYFDGGGWVNVPGGTIKGNNLVVRKISFAPITTSMIRVVVNDTALDTEKVARIVEVEACGHPPAPPKKPDGSGGATGLSARTETAFGLLTTTFDTLQGTVTLNLPDDVAAGDTISGTVITEPKGTTKDEQAKNQDSLNGYVVEVAKQDTPTQQQQGSKWVIPPVAQFIPVVLKNREGKVVAQTEVPVNQGTVVKPKPNGDYSMPPFGQAGRPISVAGPFDGDFNNTAVNLGNNTAQFLAESPRKVVVRSPANVIGASTIEVNEQNQVVARCHYQSIGVRLAAGKLNLIRGEQTTLTATLSGLDGATGPVPMQLTNASPSTVRMEGGDTQTIIVQPQEISGGVFTVKRTLTGVKPGGFSINAVVDPTDSSASGGVWRPCNAGPGGGPHIGRLDNTPANLRQPIAVAVADIQALDRKLNEFTLPWLYCCGAPPGHQWMNHWARL